MTCSNNINSQKIQTSENLIAFLDNYGWPTKIMSVENGNWIICNVIQHSKNEIRLKYLPMKRN